MKIINTISLLFSFLFMFCVTANTQVENQTEPQQAERGCLLDGTPYPEGTIYGDYICRQSEWIRGCLLDGTPYPEGTIYGDYICRQSEWVTQ